MELIRRAAAADLARIAEIELFNYRLYFYPVFRNDDFYFGELQVPALMKRYEAELASVLVYDDGNVKGFIRTEGAEGKKLFVEPVLHGRGIGSALLERAIREYGADRLWALEKNVRAIRFYQRHGFTLTNERKPEEGTAEYLVMMRRG